MLIKQVHQESAIFIILISHVCNRNDLLVMSLNLSDIAILNIKGSDDCCIISLISKNEAIKLIQNADLTEKSKT